MATSTPASRLTQARRDCLCGWANIGSLSGKKASERVPSAMRKPQPPSGWLSGRLRQRSPANSKDSRHSSSNTSRAATSAKDTGKNGGRIAVARMERMPCCRDTTRSASPSSSAMVIARWIRPSCSRPSCSVCLASSAVTLRDNPSQQRKIALIREARPMNWRANTALPARATRPRYPPALSARARQQAGWAGNQLAEPKPPSPPSCHRERSAAESNDLSPLAKPHRQSRSVPPAHCGARFNRQAQGTARVSKRVGPRGGRDTGQCLTPQRPPTSPAPTARPLRLVPCGRRATCPLARPAQHGPPSPSGTR